MHLLLQEGDRPKVSFADTPSAPPAAPVDTATTSVAQDGGNADQTPPQSSSNSFWIMLLLLFAFMWFFVIRPENKRQKKRKEFQTSLKKGDQVVTAGGLHGTIAAIDELTITLKVGDNVRMKFDRVAVTRSASAPVEAEPGKK